jgi:RluA family pseudouridine synthase
MTLTRKMESRVDESAYPLRLDLYLAGRFDYMSRSAWQKEIQGGAVSVNGGIITVPGRKIKGGDLISFKGNMREEPEVDRNYALLYEDGTLLAVSKSGDMPVHPAGAYFNNTLLMLLEKEYKCKLYPIHRLDRETSGVIIFCKDPEGAALMQKALERSVKTYTAIVYGTPPASFSVDMPIGDAYTKEIPADAVRKKRAAFEGAPESAKTLFKTMFHFGDYSVVRAYPETGRLHQIRVHLHHAGFPIVGDKIYGRDERYYIEFITTGMTKELLEKLELNRCALHALSLEFTHPAMNKRLTITSTLPPDMREFIRSRR